MADYEHAAIVIGGGPNGLKIVRNLGRHGVEVYSIVDSMREVAYSKYCEQYFVSPEVEKDPAILDSFLMYLKDRLDTSPVVFPTSDYGALLSARLREERGNFLLPLAKREVLELLVKKRDFYRSLSTVGVPHPVTIYAKPTEIDSIRGKISYPVFVKPSVSLDFHYKVGPKGLVAGSDDELRQYLLKMQEMNLEVFVQEIIPGPVTNHYFVDGYLGANSEPLALFGRRRLRMWPLSFGNSSLCMSVAISDINEMKEEIISYLSSVGFHGIFSAEFKVDERDHVGKLLEVNARPWRCNSLCGFCGVNVLFTAFLDVIGKPVRAPEHYKVGVCNVNFVDDLRSSTTSFAHRRLSLRNWVQPMLRGIEWDVLAGDDLGPAAISTKQTIKGEVLRHLTIKGARIKQREATWNMSPKTRESLQRLLPGFPA